MLLPKYISVSDFNISDDFVKKYHIIDDIPKVDYRFLEYKIGLQYNPVTVSQYALCLYDEYLIDQDEKKKQKFFRQIHWLEQNMIDIDTNASAVPYLFPHKWYDLQSPWYSGMAQGQMASALLRAYLLTKEMKYQNLAKRMLVFMLHPVKEGGTLGLTPENLPWIEECGTEHPSLILNGHLYGLIGLIEYCSMFDDEQLHKMRDKIIEATITLIPLYEKDNWLIYARNVNVNKCNKKYMGLQILEMKHLFLLTDNAKLLSIYERWNSFIHWPDFWKAVEKEKKLKKLMKVRIIKGIIKNMFSELYRKIRLSSK